MEIDARKTHTQGPTPSETGLSPPNWLVRAVRGLIPPGPGSANEIIDVLLETHGSVSQAVLRIPAVIAVPAMGWAREAFYWRMAIAQAAILFLASGPKSRPRSRGADHPRGLYPQRRPARL